MNEVEIALGSYSGGTKDNAICPAATATVLLKKKQGKAFEKLVKSFADDNLDHNRDIAVQELLNEANAAEAMLNIINAKNETER